MPSAGVSLVPVLGHALSSCMTCSYTCDRIESASAGLHYDPHLRVILRFRDVYYVHRPFSSHHRDLNRDISNLEAGLLKCRGNASSFSQFAPRKP